MKKHLILLLLTGLFAFSSCSSDDDGGAKAENTVIGTWTLIQMDPPFWDLEECPDKPLITFQDDGNADWTFYSQDNNCEGQPDQGTWSQDSSTEYTINVPQIGPLTGIVTFQSASSFTFSSTYQNVAFTLTFEK